MEEQLTLNLLHLVMTTQPEKPNDQVIYEVKEILKELFTSPPKPYLVPVN
jgi:hypothetical protein